MATFPPLTPRIPPGYEGKSWSGSSPSCQTEDAHAGMEAFAEPFHHCCKEPLQVSPPASLPQVCLLALWHKQQAPAWFCHLFAFQNQRLIPEEQPRASICVLEGCSKGSILLLRGCKGQGPQAAEGSSCFVRTLGCTWP